MMQLGEQSEYFVWWCILEGMSLIERDYERLSCPFVRIEEAKWV
jgi:hypothetical protein